MYLFLSELSGTSGKTKSSENTGRINLTKAQQGFGVLSVALGSQALTLTSLLLEDLSTEIRGDDTTYDEVSFKSPAFVLTPEIQKMDLSGIGMVLHSSNCKGCSI